MYSFIKVITYKFFHFLYVMTEKFNHFFKSLELKFFLYILEILRKAMNFNGIFSQELFISSFPCKIITIISTQMKFSSFITSNSKGSSGGSLIGISSFFLFLMILRTINNNIMLIPKRKNKFT